MITFVAHFDGVSLRPDEPVVLPENVPLHVTVDATAVNHNRSGVDSSDPFSEIERETGLADGPSDWSVEHDHYLYGTPKRSTDA